MVVVQFTLAVVMVAATIVFVLAIRRWSFAAEQQAIALNRLAAAIERGAPVAAARPAPPRPRLQPTPETP